MNLQTKESSMRPYSKPVKPVAGAFEQVPSIHRKALASLSLCMLLSSLGISIPNIALPTLVQAFSASFQNVQWVIIAYLLAVTIMLVSVGRIGDILGHRPVLLAGISLFIVASILCGIASTLGLLVAGRTLQGVGAAVLMALTVAVVREVVPREKTGSAMGLLGTMSAIGTALGPSLGGVLIAGPGWRAIFYVMAALGMLSFLSVRRYLQIDQQRAKEKPVSHGFDAMGTLLLGLMLAAYALSVTIGNGHFGRLNVALLFAAVLMGSIFLLFEVRTPSPLIRLSTFRNVALSTSLVMNAIVSTVMMATLVIGPFYLSRSLGFHEAVVGFVMSIGPIVSALSGVPAGRIVDRLGSSSMVIVGLVEMAVGSLALSLLPVRFGLSGYIIALIILTPGYQLFLAANNTLVMLDVRSDHRGVISGLLGLSRNLGLITGASVMGAVFAFASMTTDITSAPPEAVANGMQMTFAVAAGLVVIALIMAVGSRFITKHAGRT
jgi:MFS family permease